MLREIVDRQLKQFTDLLNNNKSNLDYESIHENIYSITYHSEPCVL